MAAMAIIGSTVRNIGADSFPNARGNNSTCLHRVASIRAGFWARVQQGNLRTVCYQSFRQTPRNFFFEKNAHLLVALILTHSSLGHAFKTQDADADSAPGRARGRDCSPDFSRTESRRTGRRHARHVACNRFRGRFHGHSSNPMKSAENNVPYFMKLALTAYSVQVWTWRVVGEIALSLCPGSDSVPCFRSCGHARSGWTRRRWKRAAGVDRRRSWAKWKHLGYGCVEFGRALRMGPDGCRGTGPFARPI